jgi:hypothetical protein
MRVVGRVAVDTVAEPKLPKIGDIRALDPLAWSRLVSQAALPLVDDGTAQTGPGGAGARDS